MNKIFKGLLVVLFVLFLSLYFSKYSSNYYENKNGLTEEAIKQYESDLKQGKTIDPNKYVVQEKNYNNRASRMGMKASSFVEKTFSYGLKYIIKYLENMDNS